MVLEVELPFGNLRVTEIVVVLASVTIWQLLATRVLAMMGSPLSNWTVKFGAEL